MTGDRSDAELIEASLADPEEFGALFHRHYHAIYRYLVRAVGPGDGNDLAAEVFEQAFKSRHTYDLTRPTALPWLYGIAGHLVFAHYRKRARRIRLLPVTDDSLEAANPSGWVEPGFEDDLIDRVDAATAHAELRRVLERLRPEERDVVGLHLLADLSYQEIGETLGIPVGTVRSRLSRARDRLRNLFAENDQSPSEPPGRSDE